MSQLLIRNYLNDLTRIQQISGSLTEGVISEAFKDLLKAWSKQDGLVFISQYEFVSPQKNRIRPDGTILHGLRVPFGYARRPEFETAEDKLAYLSTNPASSMTFEPIIPDKDSNWLHITDNDWESLVPVNEQYLGE